MSKTNLPALFIGRFQPFHLGHLDAVRQILQEFRSVIIGIGSAQCEGETQNPYSAEKREAMVEKSLRDEGIAPNRFMIARIPDIHDDERWVRHVETLAPAFGPVYSGSPHVQKLFQKDEKHEVRRPKFNFSISGTEVRRRMASGESWQELVPKAVVEIINQK